MLNMNRRVFLNVSGSAALLSTLAACASRPAGGEMGHVVVVGGGYGGNTAAKYLRLWSDGKIAVTLIEPNAMFVSCPMSNLVIGGSRRLEEISVSYDGLRKLGVRVVQGSVASIDADKRKVRLDSGEEIAYDRCVVSPGIAFLNDQIAGLDAAGDVAPHAWKAGAQTVLLRKQLEAMPDGGVVAISMPKAPYRCPPGPYERLCQIGNYLKTSKPKSKVILLDANEDVQSKKGLFTKVWKDMYPGLVEYRNNNAVTEIDVRNKTLITELGDKIKADVLNVIAPQRAGDIAKSAGLITANNRWCGVDWLSMESLAVKNIHVLGDATLSAPLMPKSGHMANQHGKVAAAAIVEIQSGRAPMTDPMMANTCYSYVDDKLVVHVASVHRYDAEKKTMVTVPGSGGLSKEANALEGSYAWAWAQTIWADMLT
jgi:NADPH-dependent 2,4-dienoyl-CoA reductase/sulfur reductase-like enzyme